MQLFEKSEKTKANQVAPEKIDVKVIKDDEDQYLARIDASKSKLADSVTVEKAPLMIPQLNEGGVDWFPAIMIPLQIVILILYGVYGEYQSASALDVARFPYYQDVHVMIFIGFGFLMTFLRKYGYGAVGLTLLVACLSIELRPLFAALFDGLFNNNKFNKVHFGVTALIHCDFAAAAVLISFGGVIGKISATQLMVMALFEVLFYCLNAQIAINLFITDVGGSMVIHTFGAFFGLAVSKALARTTASARGHPENSAIYHSDIFSMIGTVFLWMFWPSFNAATTSSGDSFVRAVVNTLISITGSSISAFVTSYIVRKQKKFNILHIQNATLAGGVAMGAAADLGITPAGALAVGFLAGIVSVVGYNYIQSKVETNFGITDTCGILNLHGMPGILGGIISVITCAGMSFDNLLLQVDPSISSGITARSSSNQALYQLSYLVVTLSIAIVSGFLTGVLIRNLDPIKDRFFEDSALWEVAEEEGKKNVAGLSRAEVEKIVQELTATKKAE